VGLDGFRCELGRLDLIHLLLRNAAFHLMREWERIVGVGFRLWVREAAIEILSADGRELRALSGGQRDLHVHDRDGLVAVVGYDEKDWQESVPGEVDGEYFCLFRCVVGVGGDGDLFVAMQVVGGIVECSLGGWFDETLARDKNDRTEERQECKEENAPTQTE